MRQDRARAQCPGPVVDVDVVARIRKEPSDLGDLASILRHVALPPAAEVAGENRRLAQELRRAGDREPGRHRVAQPAVGGTMPALRQVGGSRAASDRGSTPARSSRRRSGDPSSPCRGSPGCRAPRRPGTRRPSPPRRRRRRRGPSSFRRPRRPGRSPAQVARRRPDRPTNARSGRSGDRASRGAAARTRAPRSGPAAGGREGRPGRAGRPTAGGRSRRPGCRPASRPPAPTARDPPGGIHGDEPVGEVEHARRPPAATRSAPGR